MKILLYKASQVVSAVLRFIVHYVLALRYCGKGKHVSAVNNPLLLKSATQLVQEIREGKVKSADVVKAYILRIIQVDRHINATAERCFEEALNRAMEVDFMIASRRFPPDQLATEMPLLGVPISVNVLIRVKGCFSTGASKLFDYVIAKKDATSVALLKKAGAIVLVTTNAPEMGLNFETRSKLYGKCCNPYDTSKTSGGSSGGEGALISAGGSILGLGDDLSGGLRIPAHFTGIFAHKPTIGLAPNEGVLPPFRLNPSDPYVPQIQKYMSTGPMCRYAEDLVTSMKVLSIPGEVRMKFGQQVDFRRLKVYYMMHIQSPFVATVEEEIKTALRNAASHFEHKYNVIPQEVTMPSLFHANRCVFNRLLVALDDLKDTLTCGKGLQFDEKRDIIKGFFGKSTLSFMTLLIMNCAYLPMWWKEFLKPYFEELANEWAMEFGTILDEDTVLLMPTLPSYAPYHSGMFVLAPGTCYTSIFNILGLPVTQCPLGFNRHGLPHGIQIVSCKNNDPLTIACAVELEKAFGGWKSPGLL
ncbi:fatty-acid amide hydrolase 2-B [Caerostris darwini]|uniref:Fatty-acid amide hydrolase 2-B n=1 Tax=Caerostris darwini TaxID=1538125 RepID=A0AAV4W9V2_9ARAC|nr:fatty-acid amide hydrolase 2-B [Caerostris darwini]